MSTKLNTFEFQLDRVLRDGAVVCWGVHIVADGRIINEKNAIDLEELVNSCWKTGSYYILTCGCGCPECGGIYAPVRVAVWKRQVCWRVPYPEPAKIFHFDKLDVIKKVHQGISTMRQEIEDAGQDNPEDDWDYPVGPLGTVHADLIRSLDSLSQLLKSYQA